MVPLSLSCRVAVIVWPFVPLAVKVKGRETEGPCRQHSIILRSARAGDTIGGQQGGDQISGVGAGRVAQANSKLTVSPGSITPLTGPLSEIRAAPAGTIKLPSVSEIVSAAGLGLTSTALPTGLAR